MINISSIQSIIAVLSGSPATTQPQAVATYADETSTSVSPIASVCTNLNGVTEVTIVTAPSSGTIRMVKDIRITNIDTAIVTVSVAIASSTSRYYIERNVALSPGYFLDVMTGEIKPSSGLTSLTGDVTTSTSGAAAATIAAKAVTYAKIQDVSATSRLLGRSTAGAGSVEEITVGGDITQSGSTLTIGSGTVTLSKMANLAASSLMGNNTGAPATPLALTVSQVKALLAISQADVSGLTTASSPTFTGLTIGTLAGMLKGTAGVISAATAGTDYIAGGVGTTGYLPKFSASGVLANSPVYTDGTKVGIGTETPTTGYVLDVVGFVNSTQTVDQSSYPSVNAIQTASTLQDGSASTGVDESFDQTWEAIKFTASGNHNVRSFGVRMKSSATLTNPTGQVFGYLYTDSAGSPGTLISGSAYTRYGSLTTSYAEFQFAVSTTLVSGTAYWLVLKQSAAPTGGTISIDTVSSGTGLYANSTNGTSWNLEDAKAGWFKLYGRTYYGVYGSSTNSIGVIGSSTNSIGVYGSSINSYGVYGSSINSYGVVGSSINSYGVVGSSINSYGVYGSSINSYGVVGSSINSYGVVGSSTNSIGVYGSSINSYGGYFIRNASTPTSAVPVVYVLQDHASDTNSALDVRQDGTGAIFRGFDGASEVFRIADGGNVGIGTTSPAISSGTGIHCAGSTFRLGTTRTPASSTDTCNAGEIFADADYLYYGVGTNSIKRIAWTSF